MFWPHKDTRKRSRIKEDLVGLWQVGLAAGLDVWLICGGPSTLATLPTGLGSPQASSFEPDPAVVSPSHSFPSPVSLKVVEERHKCNVGESKAGKPAGCHPPPHPAQNRSPSPECPPACVIGLWQ